ncbi:hypothetical protein AAG570_011132 [Ranatra chinensis]|uniref:Uncharacterized protein n=1 Tax=Ranatra chinensis TaxID=642074 RepID=A0ABD0YK00_9HEMI
MTCSFVKSPSSAFISQHGSLVDEGEKQKTVPSRDLRAEDDIPGMSTASRIPKLNRSLCGCSLETGTKIIGFIELQILGMPVGGTPRRLILWEHYSPSMSRGHRLFSPRGGFKGCLREDKALISGLEWDSSCVRYLGLYIDKGVTWNPHTRLKRIDLNRKFGLSRNLQHRSSKLSLGNTLTIYNMILKPGHTDKIEYVKVWVVVQGAFLAVGVMTLFAYLIMLMIGFWNHPLIIIQLVSLGFQVYYILLVYSYYRNRRSESGGIV